MRNIPALLLNRNIIRILILSSLILIKISPAHSQENENISGKLEADLVVEYYKNFENTRILIVTLSTRENGKIIYLNGQSVDLYLNEISESGILGSVITDENGKGELHLSNIKFKNAAGNLTEFKFIARLIKSANYISDDDSKTISESVLDIECFKEDSVKYVKAIFKSIDSAGNLYPAEYMEVHFYIQRMLGLLPIGGDYTFTDENGEIIIEFPDDLSGNKSGKLDIIVKIEDDENYGNISNRSTEKWGAPLKYSSSSEGRSLWGSRANAPLILIIISNFIILGVWILILYLILQIFRIRKLNKDIN